MRRFSELGIKQVDDKKIFNCQQVSISDVINCEIEVLDFIPNMKTTHGDNRYLVKFRQDGQEGKFSPTRRPSKVCSTRFRKTNFHS